MHFLLKFVVAVAAFSVSLSAHADTLSLEQAWTRATPPGAANSATYLQIHNSGDGARELVSASTDAAEKVELHTVLAEDGLMKMRQVPSISVPAGGSVELKPGGFHIMMLGIKQQLREGEQVQLELRFADGETLSLSAPVKKMAKPMVDHSKMDHSKMKHD